MVNLVMRGKGWHGMINNNRDLHDQYSAFMSHVMKKENKERINNEEREGSERESEVRIHWITRAHRTCPSLMNKSQNTIINTFKS